MTALCIGAFPMRVSPTLTTMSSSLQVLLVRVILTKNTLASEAAAASLGNAATVDSARLVTNNMRTCEEAVERPRRMTFLSSTTLVRVLDSKMAVNTVPQPPVD